MAEKNKIRKYWFERWSCSSARFRILSIQQSILSGVILISSDGRFSWILILSHKKDKIKFFNKVNEMKLKLFVLCCLVHVSKTFLLFCRHVSILLLIIPFLTFCSCYFVYKMLRKVSKVKLFLRKSKFKITFSARLRRHSQPLFFNFIVQSSLIINSRVNSTK